MLKFLHIENIAVIEMCDIELTDGFNVLTGETGAGKSIIIDSINAVLGERTSKDLIRSGCDEALVTAIFGDFNKDTLDALELLDVLPDEDGNVLITRKLSLSGKGIIKINGKPFTATALREISSLLINIHGQHDNQALLNPEKHCAFVDSIADNGNLRQEYYDSFKALNKIRRELNSLITDEGEKERKIDLLKYQINELSSADIKEGEIEELKTALQIAEERESYIKAFNGANQILSGDESADGIITSLKTAAKLFNSLENEKAKNTLSDLNDLISKAEDLQSDIRDFSFGLEENAKNPDDINARLDFLYRLMVKYGGSETEMLSFLENAKRELEGITFSDKRAAELEAELQKAKNRLIEVGEKLTESRKIAAEGLSQSICAVLEYLNMSGVVFVTNITSGRYTSGGCDNVEFLISANRGEEVKPLHKIASGGELSRVMLAIKSTLLDRDSIGTMIFDEIDTGISGYAADRVGTKLKEVAQNRQVICITHLAQIAALADNHLLIEKEAQNGRTQTHVTSLDRESRIKEIARIMTGTEITENIYNSAKELLDRSKL